MKKDTITIGRKVSDRELGKIEKVARAVHCKEFGFSITEKETVISVPREKVDKVYLGLVRVRIIE